jgi:hypothetical protein
MPHRGKTASRVAIIQSGRPGPGVSSGAAPLQPTSSPKMIPSRGVATPGATNIRFESPGSRFPPKPESSNKNNKCLHEVMTSRYAIVVRPRPTLRIGFHRLPHHLNPSSAGSPPPAEISRRRHARAAASAPMWHGHSNWSHQPRACTGVSRSTSALTRSRRAQIKPTLMFRWLATPHPHATTTIGVG